MIFSLSPCSALCGVGNRYRQILSWQKKKDSLRSDLVPESLHRCSSIYMSIFGVRGATSWYFGPTVCGNCLEIRVFKSRKWQLILGTVVFYNPSESLGSAEPKRYCFVPRFLEMVGCVAGAPETHSMCPGSPCPCLFCC